ncbi:ATP-binding cassette domain-containing protein [Pukyongiella litopenaei]|uniref:ABC transporter ATP-binding protein n=1 Tax=Pukyongiella litopenaei TaxID=2605946 RepID=A0A2S0MR01_9RHOB|nr:ABC transporter ATP-binding protein [Pukyongiella litopenaei]AVO38267.1 ABC transporter ATP-binding protein [Pukyongiella litopenaei]
MNDLLTVDHLSITHRGETLVDDVSFAIPPGGRMGLIGESGSGKSLSALAITGLLPPAMTSTGSVVLAGRQVVGTPDRKLDRMRGNDVAVVFQEPLTALDPLMRVRDQIALPLKRRLRREGAAMDRGSIDAEILALLEQVRLPHPDELMHAYPHQMSGGQRQRIAIAMAAACRPRLLIADEPTTALDVTTQAEVLGLLDSLVRDLGMALLFISHDLPVVASIVDEVTVLRLGKIVEQGSVRSVFSSPGHDYTQSLLQAAKTFDDHLGDRA